MARQPRIEYEGAVYHVMARGDRREDIVEGDGDCGMFVEALGQACEKTGWRLYAWVLMRNHYHLVLETPGGNLVEGMKWFQNAYTRRFNSRHQMWGHVFGGRYKAILVDPEREGRSSDYLAALMDYVHLNPVRAGFVHPDKGMGLLDYRWSSLSMAYAVAVARRPSWTDVESGLAHFGLGDTAGNCRKFVQRLEERIRNEPGKEAGMAKMDGQSLQSTLRRGWYWGGQEFREKMLKMLGKGKSGTNRNYRSSQLGREERELQALELLEAGKRHFGLGENDGDATNREQREGRDAVAWSLHSQTTQSQKWIAEQLGMHTPANVSQRIRRFQQRIKEGGKVSRKTAEWIKMSRIVD